jgi:hypothetical protein
LPQLFHFESGKDDKRRHGYSDDGAACSYGSFPELRIALRDFLSDERRLLFEEFLLRS